MSYSSSLGLTLPAVGSLINSWGPVANTNYSIIDQGVNGLLTLSVAGAANVTLTSTSGATNQANNAIYEFTGALTGSITVFVPATTRKFTVYNNTTGAYTLTMAVVGTPGTTYTVIQGQIQPLWSDGTNIFSGHTGIATVPAAGMLSSNGTILQTTTLSTGLSFTGATLTSAYQAGTLTTFGAGLLLSGGTLSTNGLVSSTLAPANIYVGNASSIATAAAMTGDVSITNAGSTTVGTIG